MRRLILCTEYGERDAHELWGSRIDKYVGEILDEIENGTGLTYDRIERIYNHFNCIAEVDEPCRFVGVSVDGGIVVEWPESEWVVKFEVR